MKVRVIYKGKDETPSAWEGDETDDLKEVPASLEQALIDCATQWNKENADGTATEFGQFPAEHYRLEVDFTAVKRDIVLV